MTMKKLIVLAMLTACVAGCPEFWAGLAKVAQGSQWIEAIVAAAEPQLNDYFAANADPGLQSKVALALQETKAACATLEATIAAASDAKDSRVVTAEADALRAYEELEALIQALPRPTPKLGAGSTKVDVLPPRLPEHQRVAAAFATK